MLGRVLTAAVCLSPLAAMAQEVPDLRVRLGIGFGGEYRLRNGDKARATGPEFALIVPVAESRGLAFTLEPSFLAGGRLLGGGGANVDVYRITLVGRRTLSGGVYGKAGLGFAHVLDRTDQVNAASGVVGQLGVGFPLRRILQKFQPNLEVNYFASDSGQLRALSFGITGRL